MINKIIFLLVGLFIFYLVIRVGNRIRPKISKEDAVAIPQVKSAIPILLEMNRVCVKVEIGN